MKHLTIRIAGTVQDVGFRYRTKEKADALGICGIVRNEPDGSVYIEAEGDEKKLEEFLQFCRQGPHMSHVKDIQVGENTIKHYSDFTIALQK